jgi:hypothetical protein
VLCAHTRKSICSVSVSEAVIAIAHVGGFRSCPSAPVAGVKSLWLGLRRLDALEEGWQLALQTLSPRKEKGKKDVGRD